MLRLKADLINRYPKDTYPRLVRSVYENYESISNPIMFIIAESETSVLCATPLEFYDYVGQKGGIYNVACYPQAPGKFYARPPVIRGRHKVLSSLTDSSVAVFVPHVWQRRSDTIPVNTEKELKSLIERTPREQRFKVLVDLYQRIAQS